MAKNNVSMRINAFFGDDLIDLAFPDNWAVEVCRMAGHDRPPLSEEELRNALRNPIGSPRLSELAKGKKEVCILFDDIPKPTPTGAVAPYVIEELHEGGITDEQIRFICAPGTHRPMTQREFVAKLGQDIVENYMVYNHTIWENVVDVGTTSRGTKVEVNREFASCDLRIAIGSFFPHGSAGYGGGGKIILPGVSSIETVEQHHSKIKGSSRYDNLDENEFRLDLEEAARLAGLHFKVDVVINNHREVIGLFAGDLVEEHRAGTVFAQSMYKTELAEKADVVVTNAYPDEAQNGRAFRCALPSLKEGGDVVLLLHQKDGQSLHQYSSRFGTDYGARNYKPGRSNTMLEKVNRVIVIAPILSKYDKSSLGPAGKILWCRTWAEALSELSDDHGAGTKVAVYPYAALQNPA